MFKLTHFSIPLKAIMPDQTTLLSFSPNKDYLQDKVILVTGAGDGIGKQAALTYASYGATVVLMSKTIKKLEATYDQIVNAGSPEPAIYPIDFSGAQEKDYEQLAATVNEQLGSINGLLLNVGWLPGYTPLKYYPTETWLKTITINLHTHFLLLRACLPYLETAHDPAVVFSSHLSEKAYNGAFGVAKAGMDALLRITADEYDTQPFIRVNGIDTGPVQTAMRRRAYPAEDHQALKTPEALMGPYVYFMGPDAGKRTGEIIRYA